MTPVHKLTIVPLDNPHDELQTALPIELGSGLSVRNLRTRLARTSLRLWRRYLSPEMIREIRGWSICLVHQYTGTFGLEAADNSSAVLLRYATAHLRLIAPDKTDANHFLRVSVRRNGTFEATGSSIPHDRIFLQNCEMLSEGITEAALAKLSTWIPWIVKMSANGRLCFPLNLALTLSEKAYREMNAQIRVLLRVMALEALFSTSRVYGLRALRLIPKLIGRNADLYAQYNSEMQSLPRLTPEHLLSDLATFRNEIAHGNKTPGRWLKENRRDGGDHRLCYSEELAEAAAALVALSWKTIVDEGLQDTFAEKLQMHTYLETHRSRRKTEPVKLRATQCELPGRCR